MKNFRLLSLFAVSAMLCGCQEKDNPTPDPTPTEKAPTAITLSQSSFSFTKDGGEASLTVKAPFRPSFSGTPSWITVKDGTFDKYQITYTLTASANTAYEERSATVTLKATGVSDVTFTVSQEAAEKPEEPTPGTEVNQAVIDAMGMGWNMGNHFDAYYNGSWAGEKEGYPDETAWQGEKATQATFNGLKSLGFTSVRIPISWLKMIGPAPDYSIDETWMNRIYEVVGFAHNAGLTVIINTHHDENHGVSNSYQWLDILGASNNSAKNESIKAEIKAVWTQIANKFKDCDDWLIMESFNELNDGGWGWSAAFKANPTKQCNILNEWNQVFVDVVRATGGNNAPRWLGVPTYAASPSFEEYWTLPSDPAGKTMLAVHFYDPSAYTIGTEQYSDWGHTANREKDSEGNYKYWAGSGDEDHVKAVFGNLYTKYVSHGIPVYLGEYGCSMRSKSDTRAWAFYKYYMEYVVKAAKTYGLPCYLWDNGATGNGQEEHGYVNHGTGQPIGNSKEILDIIKKAWSTESAGYTLETVYNSAPKY